MTHVLDTFRQGSSWVPALVVGMGLVIYGITLVFAEKLHDARPAWVDEEV